MAFAWLLAGTRLLMLHLESYSSKLLIDSHSADVPCVQPMYVPGPILGPNNKGQVTASDGRSVPFQDVVTRGAKFLVLYKRPGKRVIVNDLGRLIVAPSSMEASIQQSTAGMCRHAQPR